MTMFPARLRGSAAWLALQLGLCGSLAAQDPPPRDLADLSLEELMQIRVDEVYTASRGVQKIGRAPADVSVVGSEQFRTHGYRTLADAFRAVRGAYVTNDRNYAYLGVRGFGIPGDYNNRVLFLLDGQRINDNVFDSQYLDRTFPLDVDLIDRVEFVRGPASSLYGSNAFFGVIHVMTKKGRELGNGELSGSVGSFGSYEGRASGGTQKADGPEVVVSGTLGDAAGQTLYFPEFDDPATNHGFARGADEERWGSAFARLSYGDFALQGAWSDRRKELPTAPYGSVFPSDRSFSRDAYGTLSLSWRRAFADKLEVSARTSLNGYWYDGEYEFDDGLGGTYLNADEVDGLWWGGELVVSKSFWDDRARVTLGGEYRDNFRQDQKNVDLGGAVLLDSRENSAVAAVFAQAELEVAPGVHLNAGLRYDEYDSFGGTLNPRLSAVWAPSDGTALKAHYGRAFRAPSAYERFYGDGVYQKASPDLDPETIETWELSVQQDLGGGFTGRLGGFYYDVEDLIQLEPDPLDGLLVNRNVAGVSTIGGDAELRWTAESGLALTATYSAQLAEQSSGGGAESWMVNSPKHLAKLALDAPLAERLYGGVDVQYVGERKTLAGGRSDDYVLVNLTFSARDVVQGMDLSVSVYNLLDQDYADPASSNHVQDQIEQDGLSFRIKLTWRF